MLRRNANIEVVREELKERKVQHDESTLWKTLLTLLKEHESDPKFFTPLLPFDVTEDNQFTVPFAACRHHRSPFCVRVSVRVTEFIIYDLL